MISVHRVMARRVYGLVGWHVELYVSAEDLSDLSAMLLSLPKVSIEHLGLTTNGFDDLLKLAENGVHIKARQFSRLDFDIKLAMRKIYHVNPNCLLFGSDFPGTRAPRCFDNNDFKLIMQTFIRDD